MLDFHFLQFCLGGILGFDELGPKGNFFKVAEGYGR